MNYKYSLDRSSRKFTCPSCQKKTFVRYIDNETSNYLEANFGRCDRESRCQYHNRPDGNKILINMDSIQYELQPTVHVEGVIGAYGNKYNQNNFIKYLQQYFCNTDIENVIRKYFIGTSTHWNGATVFWQVDEQMNICAGKVMLYDQFSGKRVKKPYSHINWMHRVLQIKDYVLQQCLFGLHNLCDYQEGSTVCVVESEKTAIIMSILYPSCLWLATGAKSNLKLELLKRLEKYNIVIFPDKTEFLDWNKKVFNLQKLGFCIECSDLLEHKNLKEGGDLADLILDYK